MNIIIKSGRFGKVFLLWIQTLCIHPAESQTIVTVPPASGGPISLETFQNFVGASDRSMAAQKIASIDLVNRKVNLSPTQRWPAGSWLGGYYHRTTLKEFLDDQPYGDKYYGSHPLTRINSKIIRGHIHTQHLYPSSFPSSANLDKIAVGINYMIDHQIVMPGQPDDGGYWWWISRPSRTTPNTDETVYPNIRHSFETAHALRTMSEAFLYFSNEGINYPRMTDLRNAIVKAADNLCLQVAGGWGDLSNSNYKGLAAWGLASAYRVTRNSVYLQNALDICHQLYIDQNKSGGEADGMWTQGVTDKDLCGNDVFHDTLINYHFIILRGLVEALDITPNTSPYTATKTELTGTIKRAVNHVISYRIALADDLPIRRHGMLHSTSVTAANGASCNMPDSWAYYFYEEVVEPVAMLVLYSKFNPLFSESEQNSLKNLLLHMTTEIQYRNDGIPEGSSYIEYFPQYAYYADYLNAFGKRAKVFGAYDHACPPVAILNLSGSQSQSSFYESSAVINSNAVLTTQANITYAGGAEIVLTDGFIAPANSTFDAFVYPCTYSSQLFGGGGGSPKASLEEEDKQRSVLDEQPEAKALSIYPNPAASGSITVKFRIAQAGHTVIRISDFMNRDKFVVVNELQEVGSYNVPVDVAALKNGIYFCKLQTGLTSVTQKIVISR